MEDKILSQAELADDELDYVAGGTAKTGCPKCGNKDKIRYKSIAASDTKKIHCLVCDTRFEGFLL